MSLKQARFDDHWRHVFSRKYSTRLTEVRFNNLFCLADGAVTFSCGITVIVGANGVGKSTLITAIADLLSQDGSGTAPALRKRLGGSSIEGLLVKGDSELRLRTHRAEDGIRTTAGDNYDGECSFVDPSDLAAKCLSQIGADKNFGDLLEATAPVILDADELAVASYLVGKSYTEILMYEIADYAGFERFPYFQATSAGVSYGSEGMGRGELSLLLTYWTLRDLKKDSILILEEPETHVSPASQESLMNVVAKFSDEMGIWVVVATHSPTIISRVLREHLKLLVRVAGPACFVREPTKMDISRILGGRVAFNGALIVEDEAAKHFLLTLIEEFDPGLLRQWEVVSAGCDSAITGILKMMPKTHRWLTLVGVYDGDVREKIAAEKELRWPHAFLPGDIAPEYLLLNFVENQPNIVQALAGELKKGEDQIRVALEVTTGKDHHDYFRVFAEAVGLDIRAVRRALVRLWLSSDGANKALGEGLVGEIAQSVNSNP